MKSLIGVCGIDCARCDAYGATKADDKAKLAEIAVKWSKEFNTPLTAESVRCHGCHATDGVQIGHCGDCEIRLCGIGKSLATCADCNSFDCEKLKAFLVNVPPAREKLEELRAGRR